MGTLNYIGVGSTPLNDIDVIAKADVENTLTNTGVTRTYVAGRVATLASGKATKLYVDTQDNLYATPTYYQNQDLLNLPTAQKGAALGVAPLVSGTIPSINIPILGAGMLKGPYGFATPYAGNASFATPLKIADWTPGQYGVNCQLICFMTVLATCDANAHPVVDVRYSTSGDTTFAGQIPFARGYGRTYFNDTHTIVVEPITATAGAGQDGIQQTIPASATLTISAWLYDGVNNGGLISTQVGYIVSSALYLARTVL